MMMKENDILLEIAQTIVEANDLRNFDYSVLLPETKLIDPPFNLDSLGILEAVASIESKYNVRIKNFKEGEIHFKDLQSIANFIRS